MEIQIKQLKQGSQIFVPQTTAEAVLVKHGNDIKRLDEVLSLKSGKIITPLSSGLTSYDQGDTVTITHSNKVTALETFKSTIITYDQHGHITGSIPTKKLNVNINDQEYFNYEGSEEQNLNFGDDFKLDSNNIQLKITEL